MHKGHELCFFTHPHYLALGGWSVLKRNIIDIAKDKINLNSTRIEKNEILLSVQGNGRNVIANIIKANSEKYTILQPIIQENSCNWKSFESRNTSLNDFIKRYKNELPIYIYAKFSDEVLDLVNAFVRLNNAYDNNDNTTLIFIKYILLVYPTTKFRKYILKNLTEINKNQDFTWIAESKFYKDVSVREICFTKD